MRPPSLLAGRRGFALVITLALLALLVLAVLALSTLVRVNGQIANASVYQTQARQNALLGLSIGLSDLQVKAGANTQITAMAGITNIAANANNRTRHWCGVWDNAGTFIGWLTSGAQPGAGAAAVQGGLTTIELIGTNAVGAAAANSEHGIAGLIAIKVTETQVAPGTLTQVGDYAYLISDEGVKIPSYSPTSVLGSAPVVFSTLATNAQGKLRDAIGGNQANLPKTVSYEQLSLIPTPAVALTPSVLQDNFHHSTLTSRFVVGAALQTGMVNVNTNSAIVLRSLLQTYNANQPLLAQQITSANVFSERRK